MAGEWLIIPSYKLDLACFCNLLTGAEPVITRHQQGYEAFRHAIQERSDLIDFAAGMLQQGFMAGNATATLLSLSDYQGDDITKICRIFDDDSYVPAIEAFLASMSYTGDITAIIQTVRPMMSEMLKHFHARGFNAYWHSMCLPAIQEKKAQFEQAAVHYPVVSRVNELLGFRSIQSPAVTLYLCSFNAPYGIGLKNAFISDIRWNFEDTVAVAVHELIHPPFDRQVIRDMAETIRDDFFFQEAKNLLPPSSGYPLPENFLEENLVEGTHLYLSEQLGVEKDPLSYLLEHDFGSHVISVILYDALKRGYRDQTSSIRETVEQLIAEQVLAPGQIKEHYMAVYQRAGLVDQTPFSAR